jgi:glycosyltransferase involved in cell wall biosynthesis
MKILIIHYRFYEDSGPESYLFKIKDLLEKYGHEVIPFSLNYNRNKATQFSEYFVNVVGDKNQFNYSLQPGLSIKEKIKIIRNLFYNSDAHESLNRLITNNRPDVVYTLQFWGKLSASVIDSCYQNRIPVILRLSDYGLICSKNTLYRKGSICEKCVKNPFSVVHHKCVDDSYTKSLLNFLALSSFNILGYRKMIDSFVFPSKKMLNVFKDSTRYNKVNCLHLPTFVPSSDLIKPKNILFSEQPTFGYIGRIAEDKGVHVIINALCILADENIRPNFIIIGDTNNQYAKDLMKKCTINHLNNVQFLGYLTKDKLNDHLNDVSFLVIPSIWFDNMPNSLLEAQSASIPVIVSDIGSLPELVTNKKNGFLFDSGNKNSLANVIKYALSIGRDDYVLMSRDSLSWVADYCDEVRHYEKLVNIFEHSIRNYEKLD